MRKAITSLSFSIAILLFAATAFAQMPITPDRSLEMKNSANNGVFWVSPDGKPVLFVAGTAKHTISTVDPSGQILSTFTGVSLAEFEAESLKMVSQETRWLQEKAGLQLRISQLQADQRRFQVSSDSAKAASTSLTNEKESLNREIGSLASQVDRQRNEAESARKSVSEHQSKLSALQQKLDELKTAEANAQRKIDEAKARLDKATADRVAASKQSNDEIASAKNATTSLKKDLDGAQKGAAQAKQNADKAKSALNDAKYRLDLEKKKGENAKADKLASLESSVTSAQSNLDEAKGTVESANARAKQLESEVRTASAREQELAKQQSTRDAEYSKTIADAQKFSQDASGELASARSNTTKAQSDVALTQSMLTSAQSTATNMDAAYSATQRTLSEKQVRAAAIDNQIAAANFAVTSYLQQKDAALQEEKGLPTQIERLDVQIREAREALAKLLILDQPQGMTVAKVGGKEYLLVAASGSRRVHVLALPELKNAGSIGLNLFREPISVTVLNDRMWVLDAGEQSTAKIKEFALAATDAGITGSYVKSFGGDNGPADLAKASQIVADPDGARLYIPIADSRGGWVSVYTTDGTYREQIGYDLIDGGAHSVAVWDCQGRGYIFITDDVNSLVRVFARDTYRPLSILVPTKSHSRIVSLAMTKQPVDKLHPAGILTTVNAENNVEFYDWMTVSQWVGFSLACR
ncbi:MAG: hypothetical protein OEM52_09845 [bacterium]|nr:hypothetical protein [bacterium]